MLRRVSKKEGLTQCQHLFFSLIFHPTLFFFLFIHFCLSPCIQVSSFIPLFFFSFFFFFLRPSIFAHSLLFFLVSKFYYKSMSTIFYHKLNVQSNSKKNLLKVSRKISIKSFKKCFIFIFIQICISCVVKIQCPK